MSEIHPTAMVEKGAKLGKGCVVGPGAIVGSEVELGDGCVVGPRAVLEGRVVMGAKNRIGVGAVIGGEPQDVAYQGAKSGVRVGEGNVFREYVTVHRGTKEGTDTVIGSGCFLMVGSHVAHNCRLADGGDVGQWGDVGRVCGGGGEGFFGWGGGGASVCPDWEVSDGAGAESDWDGSATVLHGSGHQCGVRVKFGGDSKVGSRGGGEESVGAGLRGVFLWGQESGSGAGGDS